MAMLAEPRRRQKIGPNPRGNFFLEDNENKGRTMLQKLGWQSGDGLGRRNQGMQAPIKPKIQNDAKGLGYDVKNDPWIAHTEEFAELLKSLQPVNVSTPEAPAEVGVTGNNDGGLEQKSKALRSRIHYHKFVKNKDVSKFSAKDLSCIFGKPTDELGKGLKKGEENQGRKTEVQSSYSDGEGNEGTSRQGFGFSTSTQRKLQEEDSEELQTSNKGSMTECFTKKLSGKHVAANEKPKEDDKIINRGSMIDYFKEMMAKRREAVTAANNVPADNSNSGETGEDEVSGSVHLKEVVGSSSDQLDEYLPKKKSKKSKKEKQREDSQITSSISEISETLPKNEAVVQSTEQTFQDIEDYPDNNSKRCKKSRKSRLRDPETLPQEKLEDQNVLSACSDGKSKDGSEEAVTKKEKRLKNKNLKTKDEELILQSSNSQMEGENFHHKDASTSLGAIPVDAGPECESAAVENKKKKKRKYASDDEQALARKNLERATESIESPVELSDKINKNKHAKKRKVEASLASEEIVTTSSPDDANHGKSSESSELRKKKKKKQIEVNTTQEPVGTEVAEDLPEQPEVSKKKKKKKSKKNTNQDESSMEVTEVAMDEPTAVDNCKTSFKRDKTRQQNVGEEQLVDSTIPDDLRLTKLCNQKKREKRKKKKRESEKQEEAAVGATTDPSGHHPKMPENHESTVGSTDASPPAASNRLHHKYKHKKPHLSQSEAVALSKGFSGANLHQIRGYPHY